MSFDQITIIETIRNAFVENDNLNKRLRDMQSSIEKLTAELEDVKCGSSTPGILTEVKDILDGCDIAVNFTELNFGDVRAYVATLETTIKSLKDLLIDRIDEKVLASTQLGDAITNALAKKGIPPSFANAIFARGGVLMGEFVANVLWGVDTQNCSVDVVVPKSAGWNELFRKFGYAAWSDVCNDTRGLSSVRLKRWTMFHVVNLSGSSIRIFLPDESYHPGMVCAATELCMFDFLDVMYDGKNVKVGWYSLFLCKRHIRDEKDDDRLLEDGKTRFGLVLGTYQDDFDPLDFPLRVKFAATDTTESVRQKIRTDADYINRFISSNEPSTPPTPSTPSTPHEAPALHASFQLTSPSTPSTSDGRSSNEFSIEDAIEKAFADVGIDYARIRALLEVDDVYLCGGSVHRALSGTEWDMTEFKIVSLRGLRPIFHLVPVAATTGTVYDNVGALWTQTVHDSEWCNGIRMVIDVPYQIPGELSVDFIKRTSYLTIDNVFPIVHADFAKAFFDGEIITVANAECVASKCHVRKPADDIHLVRFVEAMKSHGYTFISEPIGTITSCILKKTDPANILFQK